MTQKARAVADRRRRMDELAEVSRRHMAAYVLFNQALADYLRLHPTDLQCFNLLGLEPGPVTTGRIAEMTGLTTGSATRLVDRLEQAGYVTRDRDTEDRRRVLVAPVPERMAEFGEIWRRLDGDWYALFEAYGSEDIDLLTSHMRRAVALSTAQIERLRTGTL
ncbi:MarR family winged helix-turn-helix transcriptional regulator [Streptomyces sp. NPDC004609]|uniref:MarR family winged helix-turn-helix transcriptional regulator n=1 Tax=Streptomyces sp. NPDC004609 TaxID=3364704 RepID=UPI0036B10D9C